METLLAQIELAIARARVVLRAAVTYLTLAVVVLQFVLAEGGDVLGPEVVQVVARVVAFIGGVILIIRRVTPAEEDERGLLG